ncbi:hypothetical protein F5Y00DRAFT_270073 [Daldinia vernicosa]|uniref:uncharacterized protein n=1 Tax=Daldinia vernicosa TaxID=114800 RepID=UPI002007791F|nr:uncharacterized protein F5Y00DRAFT_270073 [Daldinia vernicosa]KAI0848575.1 hypothetical protein F5Y00DRAFT_270073 [Daldinia vernicosa]
MKFSIAFSFMSAGLVAAVPSANQIRSVNDVLPNLKRDASGAGFAHLGSDNVVRTFDKNFNVVDFAKLDDRSAAAKDPSADVLAEAKLAKSKAVEQTSKPRKITPLDARQEKSCPSQSCPDDSYCKGLSIYGYDCSTCYSVTHTVGNCQA